MKILSLKTGCFLKLLPFFIELNIHNSGYHILIKSKTLPFLKQLIFPFRKEGLLLTKKSYVNELGSGNQRIAYNTLQTFLF